MKVVSIAQRMYQSKRLIEMDNTQTETATDFAGTKDG